MQQEPPADGEQSQEAARNLPESLYLLLSGHLLYSSLLENICSPPRSSRYLENATQSFRVHILEAQSYSQTDSLSMQIPCWQDKNSGWQYIQTQSVRTSIPCNPTRLPVTAPPTATLWIGVHFPEKRHLHGGGLLCITLIPGQTSLCPPLHSPPTGQRISQSWARV